MQASSKIIKKYYDAFNSQNMIDMLNCLSDDVIHDINQGISQKGKDAFSRFMEHMNNCYKERITDLIIMSNTDGSHAAAEFVVEGTYLNTDTGLPVARNQKYRLAVGTFFSIFNNKITRVTTYYNMNDWLEQVNHE